MNKDHMLATDKHVMGLQQQKIRELESQLADLRDAYNRAPKIAAEEANAQKAALKAQLAEANVATTTRLQAQQLTPLAAASIATEARAGDCLNCGRRLPLDGDCWGCAVDIAWADLNAANQRAEAAEAREGRLRAIISRALNRYDDPNEKHNKEGGFPRGELAWAMASDLREALQADAEHPKESEEAK